MKRFQRSGRRSRILPLSVAFLMLMLTAGIWLHILGGVIDLIRGPERLEGIAAEEYDHQYVETEILYVLDCFTEYVTEKKDGSEETKWLYYIVPTDKGSEKYMAIRVRPEAGVFLDQICDETWEHLFGGEDTAAGYVMTGKLTQMEGEELKYYYEWFEEIGFTQTEIDAHVVPYVIMDGLVGGEMTAASTPSVTVVCFGVSLILLLAAVFCLLRVLTGGR